MALSRNLPTSGESHDIARVVLLLNGLEPREVGTKDALRCPRIGGSVVAVDRNGVDVLSFRGRNACKVLGNLRGSLRDNLVVRSIVPLESDGDRNEWKRAVGRVRRRPNGGLLENRGKEGLYSN